MDKQFRSRQKSLDFILQLVERSLCCSGLGGQYKIVPVRKQYVEPAKRFAQPPLQTISQNGTANLPADSNAKAQLRCTGTIGMQNDMPSRVILTPAKDEAEVTIIFQTRILGYVHLPFSGGQLLTSSEATAFQYIAAGRRAHSFAKPVFTLPLAFFGVECRFHIISSRELSSSFKIIRMTSASCQTIARCPRHH